MYEPDDERVTRRESVIVERRNGLAALLAALLVVAVIAVAIWLLFLADEDRPDGLIPDDVDVTVETD